MSGITLIPRQTGPPVNGPHKGSDTRSSPRRPQPAQKQWRRAPVPCAGRRPNPPFRELARVPGLAALSFSPSGQWLFTGLCSAGHVTVCVSFAGRRVFLPRALVCCSELWFCEFGGCVCLIWAMLHHGPNQSISRLLSAPVLCGCLWGHVAPVSVRPGLQAASCPLAGADRAPGSPGSPIPSACVYCQTGVHTCVRSCCGCRLRAHRPLCHSILLYTIFGRGCPLPES